MNYWKRPLPEGTERTNHVYCYLEYTSNQLRIKKQNKFAEIADIVDNSRYSFVVEKSLFGTQFLPLDVMYNHVIQLRLDKDPILNKPLPEDKWEGYDLAQDIYQNLIQTFDQGKVQQLTTHVFFSDMVRRQDPQYGYYFYTYDPTVWKDYVFDFATGDCTYFCEEKLKGN